MVVCGVPGRRDVHRSAFHHIFGSLGYDAVFEVWLEPKADVVNDYVGAFSVERVVGQPQDRLGHSEGGLDAGEGQFGVGSNVVDDLHQGCAFVAVAFLVGVYLDAGGQVSRVPGRGPCVRAVGNDAYLHSFTGQSTEGPHQVGPVDGVALREF